MTIKYKEITMKGRCFIVNRDDPRVYEVDDDDPYAAIVPRTEMYGEVNEKNFEELEGMSQAEVAFLMGVSKTRIAQIEDKALRKLRNGYKSGVRALLREFL